MNAPSSHHNRWSQWGGVLPGFFVALLPLLVWRRQFTELFWFGDEWDLLDQIQRGGFWHWTWTVFAENFVPLFKLLWGGAVWLGGGSYFVMILLLWLTHAANTLLFGRLLRQAGFAWFPTWFCQVVFALSSTNIETLAWSVQWSAVLATTFLLLALDAFMAFRSGGARPTGGQLGCLVAHAAGSAFSFSRGVLTGAVLALGCLWPSDDGTPAVSWWRRLGTALLCVVPALVATGLIVGFSSGNHQHLNGGTLGSAATYGLWYFCLNPLHRLLDVSTWGAGTVALLGLAKAVLIGWALYRSRGRTRLLLVLLLAFDLGSSVLLGIGRYHTGLETTISSRYQYYALLATLPFIGLSLESLARFCPPRMRRVAASLLLVLAGYLAARHWPQETENYGFNRGTYTRQLLFSDAQPPAQGAIPGIPGMPTARAKELIQIYHLH